MLMQFFMYLLNELSFVLLKHALMIDETIITFWTQLASLDSLIQPNVGLITVWNVSYRYVNDTNYMCIVKNYEW